MSWDAARRLIPLAVFAAALASFLPALGGEFLNWDDWTNFVSNPFYRGLGWQQIRWMFTSTLMGHYIPLTWLTLGLNYALGGMNPWGYHLLSLLFHAANAVLLYFLAQRLLTAAHDAGSQARCGDPGGSLAAAFAALLFAVHPLRVESVAWITERRDVLCGFFFLLSVLAYVRGAEGGGLVSGRWRILSLAAAAAALLSKAAAMPLPLVLLLLDVYPLRRRALGWRRLLVEKAPWTVLATVAAVVALLALPRGGPVTDYDRYGPLARLAMVGYSLAFYPRKFLWPTDLSPLYELPARVDVTEWRFAASLTAVLLTTAGLILARHRWPAGLAAWTYSAVMVLPVSGIVHSGHQLAHDRYSYLSGLGFALLAGSLIPWLAGAWRSGRMGALAACALVIALALVPVGWGSNSWRQSRLWHDSETLFRWAVATDPNCAVCSHNLGGQILHTRRDSATDVREAEVYLRRAIALRPGPEMATTHYNLGLALEVQQRYPEAEAAYRDYARLAPSAPEAPAALGLLLLAEDRVAEAVPLLRRAVAVSPRDSSVPAQVRSGLEARAAALARAGRTQEAAALASEAAAVSVKGAHLAIPAMPGR